MNCDWCKEPMDVEAVVCPTCNRDRKDFHNLKLMMYFFSSIFILAIFYGVFSETWLSPFLGQFEIERLIQSVMGWIAIMSLALSIWLYIKASKIVKTWWWY